MPIHDIYSRRKRRAEQTEPDIYEYDEIPQTLRVQVCNIFRKSIGIHNESPRSYQSKNLVWRNIREILAQELGRVSLANYDNPQQDCLNFWRLYT